MNSSPLLKFPDKTIFLPAAFFGSVGRYALIAATGEAIVDTSSKYNKRLKSTHRTEIADVNGRLTLTVPIEKPTSLSRARWNDIKLSTHGQWWHVLKVALESAYGRTPYFEFLIDRFLPFFSCDTIERFQSLMDFDNAIETEICRFLCITPPVYKDCINENCTPTHVAGEDYAWIKEEPYYQIRTDNRGGFIANLSILDLLFNMGPEAVFVLKKMTDTLSPEHLEELR